MAVHQNCFMPFRCRNFTLIIRFKDGKKNAVYIFKHWILLSIKKYLLKLEKSGTSLKY